MLGFNFFRLLLLPCLSCNFSVGVGGVLSMHFTFFISFCFYVFVFIVCCNWLYSSVIVMRNLSLTCIISLIMLSQIFLLNTIMYSTFISGSEKTRSWGQSTILSPCWLHDLHTQSLVHWYIKCHGFRHLWHLFSFSLFWSSVSTWPGWNILSQYLPIWRLPGSGCVSGLLMTSLSPILQFVNLPSTLKFFPKDTFNIATL